MKLRERVRGVTYVFSGNFCYATYSGGFLLCDMSKNIFIVNPRVAGSVGHPAATLHVVPGSEVLQFEFVRPARRTP